MDRCWTVPFGAAVSAFLLVMMISCYGYVAVLLREKYGVNHQKVSWIASAVVISKSTSGTGIGTALIGLSVYLLLYFDEYRGTATAIMWIFRATSGMAGMPLLWFLTTRYGVQGCLLVMGGLVLNCVPIVMLIKSPRPCYTIFRNAGCRSKAYTKEHGKVESPGTKTFAPISLTDHKLPQCFIAEKTATTGRSHIAFSSFTSFPFYVLVLQSLVSDYVFPSFSMTIVAYAVDKGFELHQGNQIVVCNAVGLLIGRIVVPIVTDKISFSRCPLAALCYTGVAEGYILCIETVLIADYQGVAGVSFCSGVAGLLTIPVWLWGPIIIGFFRDTKGSYDLLYVTFAALCFTAASLLAYLTYRDITQRKQRKERRTQDNGSSETEPIHTDVLTAKTKQHLDC
ncbi:hypothetical protein MTO96_041444 [Rhipicephalus appendiculatus]